MDRFEKLKRQLLDYVEEYMINAMDSVIAKRFPLGKRMWCIECAKRIKKQLIEDVRTKKTTLK